MPLDISLVMSAFRGCDLGPSLSRVCRRPDVSTNDSSGELGAVARRRDAPPVLRACPGCPRLSKVCRRPDVSTVDSSGELGAVTRRRDAIPLTLATARPLGPYGGTRGGERGEQE